jgi:O-antigen ligase
MDKTQLYPDAFNQINYGLQKQFPSYQSEFPNDLPFDAGATSGLFELNYFPSTASKLLFVLPVLILLFVFFYRKLAKRDVGGLLFLVSMALVFFGPLRLPSLLRFNTTLGMVKAIGLLLVCYTGIMLVTKKIRFTFFDMPSIVRVGVYVVSLMLSIFVMTNPSFFLDDFGIVLTGILFFFLGYQYFSWGMARSLLLVWARLLIVPSVIVMFIFVNAAIGKELMSLLFQRYDNFVFLHDLNRGRIFSIIDFEYFIPAVAMLLIAAKGKGKLLAKYQFYLLTAASFVAVLLVNYRYRFLTFMLGLAAVSFLLKRYTPLIRRHAVTVIVSLGTLYFILSVAFFRTTILDRFLVKNYAEDQVSIERRLIMYGQAWDLFMQKPILGVGLGNYKDNVQIVYSRFGGRTYEPFYKILQNVYAYPHNWFLTVLAENGIIGFAVLLWLLSMFGVMDVRLYKKLSQENHAIFLMISTISWLYVFANMFTMMHVSLPMVIVFWACRGMIERMYREAFGSVPLSERKK